MLLLSSSRFVGRELRVIWLPNRSSLFSMVSEEMDGGVGPPESSAAILPEKVLCEGHGRQGAGHALVQGENGVPQT